MMDRPPRPESQGLMSRRHLLEIAAATGVTLPIAGAVGRLLPAAFAAAAAPKKNIADVLRFSTKPQGWKGLFGFVTFRLHPVFVDGKQAYHIRTDAADETFARQAGLVYVPRVSTVLKSGDHADYYVFTNGAGGQRPVASTMPGRDDYTPAFRLSRVIFTGTPRVLNSAAAIRDAASSGRVKIVETKIVVNYPFVRWPDGELARDTRREAYLGEGQLLSRPDPGKREVTFKLHQCFPGEWYIVTDTSAAPMAPMMRIAASPRTQGLTKAGATAKILVFGNGLQGSGPMGFQPSVVDSLPGHPLWSPFWDHFTFTWGDGKTPAVLKTQEEITAKEKAGDIKRWPGTPDTNGQLFVVNCPVPVTAPMTWSPA
jgi:hypothetical protein